MSYDDSHSASRMDDGRRRSGNGRALQIALVLAILVLAGVGTLMYFSGVFPFQSPLTAANGTTQGAAAPAQVQGNGAQQPAQTPWQTVATYGNWEVKCRDVPNAARACNAVLEVVNQKTHALILGWIIGPDGKGGMGTVLQTPSGVAIASGVEIKFGTTPVRRIGYVNCLPQICTAGGPVDEAFLKDATAADKADVTIYPASGKSLQFSIPVKGLGQALADLKK